MLPLYFGLCNLDYVDRGTLVASLMALCMKEREKGASPFSRTHQEVGFSIILDAVLGVLAREKNLSTGEPVYFRR